MKTTPAPLLALGLGFGLVLGSSACETTRLSDSETFEEAIRTYAVTKETKAFAVAADEHGKKTWASKYGKLLSEEGAVKGALESCNENARARGVAADCYLFAVGDRQPRSTLEKCQSGQINKKRCTVQQDYSPLLTP
jgi:hypothetical protein